MGLFTRRTGFFIVGALAFATAACSTGNPTEAAISPSDATLRGGIGFGSGNVTGTMDHNTMAADSGSTARGGIGFGSGN